MKNTNPENHKKEEEKNHLNINQNERKQQERKQALPGDKGHGTQPQKNKNNPKNK